MLFLLICCLGCACSVAEPKTAANSDALANNAPNAAAPVNPAGEPPKGATIAIDPNGPADTVRAFYKHLHEKKFREAIFLTNLRPAVEGLTDTELKDFALDLATLAGQVPSEIEINGEIITGDAATVTANLPNEEGDKKEIQSLKLKKIGGIWIIQTVDAEAETRIRKEGKEYFYNLRIEVHESEAKKMLERISKAEVANSLQNGGLYANMGTLISAGLLPDDIKTNESTGYDYVINVTPDKKDYFATATPAAYGKSGKLSFLLQLDSKGISRATSKDIGGRPLRK